jgi:hypothetical protein
VDIWHLTGNKEKIKTRFVSIERRFLDLISPLHMNGNLLQLVTVIPAGRGICPFLSKGAFEIAGRIQNPNLTRVQACVALRSCGRKASFCRK